MVCPSPAEKTLRFSGPVDALVKLVRHEGPATLWRGLPPTLVMAVPSTVVYFSLYDHLKISFAERAGAGLQAAAPLFAGMAARSATTALVSPFELIRTVQQAQAAGTAGSSSLALLKETVAQSGARGLWRGLSASLWRDVPFSAIYWMLLEELKAQWLADSPRASYREVLVSSFVSGAASGAVAAVATHPFDLVKTRRQIQIYALDAPPAGARGAGAGAGGPQQASARTFDVLRNIVRDEGLRGAFTGLTARVAKIAPACAIMISSYEFSKAYFRKSRE
jgi:solute carrier family 25 protein 39/40